MRLISYRPPFGGEALGVRRPPLLLGDGDRDELSGEIERIGRLVNTCRWESIGVPA